MAQKDVSEKNEPSKNMEICLTEVLSEERTHAIEIPNSDSVKILFDKLLEKNPERDQMITLIAVDGGKPLNKEETTR